MSSPEQLIEATLDSLVISPFQQASFMAGSITCHQPDATSRQVAQFGKQDAAGPIGSTVDRRCSQGNFEFAALQADDPVATGTWLNIDQDLHTGIG
jgi:hypothetical protein